MIISALLVGFLLNRIGIQNIINHFRTANTYWLLGALILFTASHFVGSFQWWLLLVSENIEISWIRTVSFYFIGLFFNNYLVGNLGGDIFRMMDIKRYANEGTSGLSTVFLDRFAGLFVLSVMAVCSGTWFMIFGGIPSSLRLPMVVMILFWILIILFLFSKNFAYPFAWLFRKYVPSQFSEKAKEVYLKIHSFGRRRNLLFIIFVTSLLIQSARIMTHYMIGRSLGLSISPILFFLVVPIIAIVVSIPITIGGIGLREQTGVLLFSAVGLPAGAVNVAAPMEFLAYCVAILSSLPGGIIFILRKREVIG